MPTAYIIAGSNGAGKTTFANEFLPDHSDCAEFVNADLIAAGLSPFSPDSVASEAGRIVLQRIRKLIRERRDFAFETTLSGRTHAALIAEMKSTGYRVVLIYLWIPDPELALCRIGERVHEGGHDVPESVVRRRFSRSLHNLFELYAPLSDTLFLYDNSTSFPRPIFIKQGDAEAILDKPLYNKVCCQAGAPNGQER